MTEARIREVLLTRAAARAPKTLCPSEVARALSDDWRPLMDPVREAARGLVREGRIEITQRGQVVDPTTARGPIRLRLATRPAAD